MGKRVRTVRRLSRLLRDDRCAGLTDAQIQTNLEAIHAKGASWAKAIDLASWLRPRRCILPDHRPLSARAGGASGARGLL